MGFTESFGEFLLTEEKNQLGQRIGDVLTALQDLQSDMQSMGSRHLTRSVDEVANRIRKIIHGQWSPKQKHHLKNLAKVGIALLKTIDEKGDVREILPIAAQEIQRISGKLGVKVNKLEAPEEMGPAPTPDASSETQPPQDQPPKEGSPENQPLDQNEMQ